MNIVDPKEHGQGVMKDAVEVFMCMNVLFDWVPSRQVYTALKPYILRWSTASQNKGFNLGAWTSSEIKWAMGNRKPVKPRNKS